LADNFPRADFQARFAASERPEATGKIISECAGLGESCQGYLPGCGTEFFTSLTHHAAVAALDLAFPGEVRDMLARPEASAISFRSAVPDEVTIELPSQMKRLRTSCVR